MNVSSIVSEVCKPDTSSAFHFWSKPIRAIVDKWLKRRHLDAREIATLKNRPWSITNIPTYANYTYASTASGVEGGWLAHVHGNLYKRRDLSRHEIDKLINRILIRASIKPEKLMYKLWFQQLTPREATRSRRQVRDLATAAIGNGAIDVSLCANSSVMPFLTNEEGAFEQWVTRSSCEPDADDPYTFGPTHDSTTEVQTAGLTLKPLNVGGGPHNESMHDQKTFFVPPRGLTIVSDVDDVLRVGEIWNWKQAIMDLYARPYEPWLGMADVYRNWSRDIPFGGGGHWRNGQWVDPVKNTGDVGGGTNGSTNVHFHYASDSPEVNAGFYIDGTQQHFPSGSFDFRSLDYIKWSVLDNARITNIRRLLETFPESKFILVSDTTSKSSMTGFPKLVTEFPDQVQCLLMRDVQATEPSDYVIPATRHFLKIPRNKYLFFRTPAGSKSPTLANISTSHLASLARLEPSMVAEDGYSAYAEDLADGCFPVSDALPQSIYPDRAVGTRLRTTLNLAWFKIKCAFIPKWRRPSHACPFDRRPGAVYWDKGVEPSHDW
ncbi:hypothetical protein AAFC00_006718 [Neodothiora populina]|uniref:Phosphatidate phosphatase APP1 catalytic domain-containing protein n=1 Tax=Neodothiora populina TaxID=2781224 RepID=A0ABR3PAY1_9PEZI